MLGENGPWDTYDVITTICAVVLVVGFVFALGYAITVAVGGDVQ